MFKLLSMLGGPFAGVLDKFDNSPVADLKNIARFLDDLIIPMTIIVAIIGAGWIIWLGVKLAKADDESKATAAKQNLIRVAIAVIAVIVLIWLLVWVISNLGTWLNNNPIGSSASA